MRFDLLALGAVVLSTGIPAMFRPAVTRARREKARQARISQLEEGEPELYFEERRSLEAYPGVGSKSDLRMLIFGVLMSFLGCALLVLAFVK